MENEAMKRTEGNKYLYTIVLTTFKFKNYVCQNVQ